MDFLSSNPRTMAFQGAVFSPASFSFLNWQIKRKVFLNSCIRLSAFEFQVLHSIKLHLLPEFSWGIKLIVLNYHGNVWEIFIIHSLPRFVISLLFFLLFLSLFFILNSLWSYFFLFVIVANNIWKSCTRWQGKPQCESKTLKTFIVMYI